MRINPMLWEFSNSYRRYKTALRLVQIVFWVLKLMLGFFFRRLLGRIIPKRLRPANAVGEGALAKVRLLIEQLGPMFIKFGQILSTRTECPDVLREELKKLQETVPPFSYQEANDIIEQELAAPIEELFLSFEKEPIAAASLAQVHRAWLREEEEGEGPVEVAVKVQRPNLGAIIAVDLAVMEFIAKMLHRFLPRARILNAPDIIDGFGTALKRETDFYLEGRHADKVAKIHKNDRYVKIPKIYWDYTTDKVLTMEFIHGIRINQFEEIDKAGWDRYTIANNMARAYFKQILKEGFLHADPHPGNLYIQDEDVICFLDFGMTEDVPDELLDKLTDLLVAIIHDNDALKTAEVLMRINVGRPEVVNFKKLVIDLYAFLDRRFVEGKIPLGVRGVGYVLNELLYVILWSGIQLPLPLILVIKAILYVEMLAIELYPGFDLVDVLEPHMERRFRKKIYKRLEPLELRHPRKSGTDIGDAAVAAADYLKDLPRQLTSITSKIERGELEFRTREVGKGNHNLSVFNIIILLLIIGLIIVVVIKF